MKDVDLEVIDRAASASRVRVRSTAVGDGYFPEPDEEKLGRGFFVPDDLLTKTEHGLRIAGGISDVINAAGKQGNPAESEAHLLRFQGARQALVFSRASARRDQDAAPC